MYDIAFENFSNYVKIKLIDNFNFDINGDAYEKTKRKNFYSETRADDKNL